MYYLRLLTVMAFICATSLAPLFTIMGLNELFDPNVCWAKIYSDITPYVSLGSVFIAMGIVIKFDEYFLRFIRK